MIKQEDKDKILSKLSQEERDIIHKYNYMFELMYYHLIPPTKIEAVKYFFKEIGRVLSARLLYLWNPGKVCFSAGTFKKFHRIQYPIIYGIACDKGWYPIIEELLQKISEIDTDKKVRIFQIKEKFGTLRFYTSDSPLRIDFLGAVNCLTFGLVLSEMEKLIRDTEIRSAVTCEICGKNGRLRNKSGWVKTLCDEHAKEQGYEDFNTPVAQLN